MFGRKTKSNEIKNRDMDTLLALMDSYIAGEAVTADAEIFDNPEIADKFNKMLARSKAANNAFVMQINDSMTRIGDSSIVREMIEEITEMRSSMANMTASEKDLGDSITNILQAAHSIQENSHLIMDISTECERDMHKSIAVIDDSTTQISEIDKQIVSFRENAEKITDIIDRVKDLADNSSLLALNASIEAARAGEAGRGFGVVAQQMSELSGNTANCADYVTQYVGELLTGIMSLTESINKTAANLHKGNELFHQSVNGIEEMNNQLQSVNQKIEKIYKEINTQSALTQSFIATGEILDGDCEKLYGECMNTGKRFYQISREVDQVRSDMARSGSALTTLDWMDIYEVDHLIFTWRLYNMIAGYETLRIDQVNNPKGCKVGKWFAAQTDTRITGSTAFKDTYNAHDRLHKCAVDCWQANADGKRDLALRKFYDALSAYSDYVKAINSLKSTIKGAGDSRKTEFKKFWK